ncbi:LacI family DNA-binding transcriptional regulator [Pelagibacterium sp. H642]|uniref:LacI family DNA-binding transcriptional regulator n=1 Tax=Pelagibacterium sp. H642 TaxID=1881069 RepID=UPI002816593E|nr:LacI family DNA-binding transcriptional regulator [Pelagibacterium sp. H642]WMT90894.1 LacI family transcriptional regulator [Pelagibacterium sp. H642]
MKSATANDVARLAGVSRSAVSRTFSGNGFVSSEKREKILKAAQQLDYRPNAIASSLASRQSNMVAVIINKLPDGRSPYFYNALMNAIQEQGLLPLMVMVEPGEDGIRTLNRAAAYPVRGMVVMGDSVHPAATGRIVSMTRPIILNGQWTGDDEVDAVVIDQRQGISDMVADLAATGHRTVAFMGGRSTALIARDRRSALIDAMVAHGLTLVAEGNGDFKYDQAHEEVIRMFSAGKLPDALFCANDIMAFAAMDALRYKLGRNVPDDISVIGYDDNISARWGAYQLSTIRQSSDDVIGQILSLLTEPRQQPGQFRVRTEYIRRTTVALRR